MTEQTEGSLPAIGDLFRESWEAFTKSVLNLLLLAVITIVAYAVVLGIIFLIVGLGGGLGVLKYFSERGAEGVPSIASFLPALTGLGLGFLFFILFAIIFGLMVQVAAIIIVGEDEQRPSLTEVLSRSLGLVWPLFLTNLLLFFFTAGGLFVLFLPMIVFEVLFIFTPYEVVLGEKRFLGAVKGSYQIVTQNFGDLLVRGLVWLGLVIGVFMVLSMPQLTFNLGREAGLVWLPMVFVFGLRAAVNVLIGWFGLCFGVTLYKQTKAVTDFEKKFNFSWVWVIAILGWVLAGVVGFASYSWMSKLVKSGLRQKNLQRNIQRNIQIPQSKFLPES